MENDTMQIGFLALAELYFKMTEDDKTVISDAEVKWLLANADKLNAGYPHSVASA